VAPDWNALAAYWHCFEIGGFNKSTLSAIMSSLISPLLYVGGGRGTYPAYLQKWLGRDNVTVVDLSSAMARRAQADFGLEYIVADVRHLPCSDNGFASVLCVTGIFEYLETVDHEIALREMARVCCKGGPILITAAASPGGVKEVNQSHLSFDRQPRIDEHRRLETWFRHYDALSNPEKRTMSLFNAVAREMGDRVAAYHLLKDSLPRYGRRITFSSFASTIAAACLLTKSRQYMPERGIGIWHLVLPEA
jgi:ubiquinone/menaquinone biosynthesis C-methylase UbiE